MCSFLLELQLQVHSGVELSSSFGKRQKTLGPWLILLRLNILLEPATQTTSHGIIPAEIEEEVAAGGGTIGLFEHKIRVLSREKQKVQIFILSSSNVLSGQPVSGLGSLVAIRSQVLNFC